MPRETKKIITPSGITLEVKAYATGRDKREFGNFFIDKGIGYNQETQSPVGLNSKVSDEGQEKGWSIFIVSINEKKEPEIKFADIILDMAGEDYDFVVEATNKFFQKKTV